MLEITFGNIRGGWAETTFNFGDQAITVGISYICDPFGDLADAALRLLKQETPVALRFTDEDNNYDLRFDWRDGRYHITLTEHGYFNADPQPPEKPFITEGDPKKLAAMMWRELDRMSRIKEARNFMCDESFEPRFRWHYPDAKLAELEKALMG